jgi:hypothetical protein
MKSGWQMVNCLYAGDGISAHKQHDVTLQVSKYRKDAASQRRVGLFKRQKENQTMNKAIFDEKWKLIRGQVSAKWGLMAEYDLSKVDKAQVKFDTFATKLQVKYGYTRQKAKEEIGKLWADYQASHGSNA